MLRETVLHFIPLKCQRLQSPWHVCAFGNLGICINIFVCVNVSVYTYECHYIDTPPMLSLVYVAMLYYSFERNNSINNALHLLSVYYVETAMQVFVTYFHE